jgi:hypothetical protein
MNEKSVSSSLDSALANVNPERRRLLAILLAGAVALPLLATSNLSATTPSDGKGKKPSGSGPITTTPGGQKKK